MAYIKPLARRRRGLLLDTSDVVPALVNEGGIVLDVNVYSVLSDHVPDGLVVPAIGGDD